jgi:hypothetical protein
MSGAFTVHTDATPPITFLVHPDPEGGLTAKAEGHGIFVQGDTMSALQSAAAEAVRLHFASGGGQGWPVASPARWICLSRLQ